MIFEFALDPALVATWHDRLEYLYYEEKFGVHTRRIVSIYPKEWKKLVWEFVDKNRMRDLERKRIEIILQTILLSTIKRVSTFSNISDWLERTEIEHEQRPFRAILSINNPRANPFVIKSCSLLHEGHELWNIPDLNSISRTSEDIANGARPVLQFCKKAVFIEPYYSPDKTAIHNTLESLFGSIWNQRIAGSDPEVQLQTKLDNDANQEEALKFISNCEPYLSKIIPLDKKVTLTIKKNKTNQQRFHNRYILTESIGLGLPSGLTGMSNTSNETDDIYILSQQQHKERWMQYVNCTPSPFELLAQKSIFGLKR